MTEKESVRGRKRFFFFFFWRKTNQRKYGNFETVRMIKDEDQNAEK